MTADAEPRRPVLEGVIGWVRGEVFTLKPEANVIGRSRHCDISLRQSQGYLRQAAGERDLDHDFNTVSRRHAVITVRGHQATIEDLSTNGTFCNEVLLTERRTFDLHREAPLLRLGTRESFRLSLWPEDGAGSAPAGEQAAAEGTDPFDVPCSTEHVDVSRLDRAATDAPGRTLKNP